MKRLLGITLLLSALTVLVLLTCTGCTLFPGEDTVSAETLPPVTTAEIEEGVLFARCSEPENNAFSVQFIGVVPTSRVDYVGFEACIVYPDGTRGTRKTAKLYTLYSSVDSEDGEVTITSEDFGVKDGYLFVRTLDGIPIDQEGLAYEVAAYYMIGTEKTYTAKQVFDIQTLLEEHILTDPKPLPIEDRTELIDVQTWVRYENEDYDEESTLSPTYYLGASLPDANGNLKMYACVAVATEHLSHVGIRYNFTQKTGDYAGVSTALSRSKIYTLYRTVISESDTLTVEDFGLTDGYLALIPFEENVNIVSRAGYTFNLLLYYSRNALETVLVNNKLDFTQVIKSTVLSRKGAMIGTYTFIPTDYHEWMNFSEKDGNATGTGLLRIRLTDATNEDGDFKFSMQIATAVPTRFSNRIAFRYTAYDAEGNVVGTPNREINATTIYKTIFDNNDTVMKPSDFGMEYGYIMTMVLGYVEYDSGIESIKIEATYLKGEELVTLASLTVEMQTLRELIKKVL
ncbi:MAG: hypothetical protein IKC63_07725 [Clostridia bacterium]|nr:hypothetical protein [Clostridia bacterium]